MKFELDIKKMSSLQTMFSKMLEDCPQPTTGEISKLLSLQGYYWQRLSLMHAHLAEEEFSVADKGKDLARFQKRIRLAVEMGREARNCMTTSAKLINDAEKLENENIKLDLEERRVQVMERGE